MFFNRSQTRRINSRDADCYNRSGNCLYVLNKQVRYTHSYCVLYFELCINIRNSTDNNKVVLHKYLGRTGIKPIEPITPNLILRWSYILSAVQIHTITSFRFYREHSHPIGQALYYGILSRTISILYDLEIKLLLFYCQFQCKKRT